MRIEIMKLLVGFAHFLLISTLAIGVQGCTHQQLAGNPMYEIFQDMLVKTPKEAPPRYRHGQELLETKKYAEALTEFDRYLSETGASRWSQAAVVNSGRALEGMSRWSEALSKYRAAIESTQRRAPKLQTYALYRASFCYEELGEDTQTVAVLLDLLAPERAKYLPKEAVIAEIPGRLAGTYASLGQLSQAVAFYQRAETGIEKLKASAHGVFPEWLGQTLFEMGKVPTELVSWENAATVLRVLERNQKFAVEAAALNQDPWSREASQSLIGSYRDLFTVMQTPQMSKWDDPLLSQRDAQRSQWNLASEMLQRLGQLQSYRLPDPDQDSDEANEIFDFADELSKKLEAKLQEQPAGDGLTEASAARIAHLPDSSLPQVIAPDSRLEQAAITEERPDDATANTADTKAEKTRVVTPKVVNPKSTDPNL